jgi:iron-sulfur cluster repair protein YtfE (RIC family)
MNTESKRLSLLQQHERIRAHLQTCTRLATLYRAGDVEAARQLDAGLDALRDEIAVHNQAETGVIRQLLHGNSDWGALLIDRMFEEHVAEHAAFWEVLSHPGAELADRINDLADELDAHMAAEERTFLAPGTLRDEVIAARTRNGLDR